MSEDLDGLKIVFAMSNAELSQAIDRTREYCITRGTGLPDYQTCYEHLKSLLEVELQRAKTIYRGMTPLDVKFGTSVADTGITDEHLGDSANYLMHNLRQHNYQDDGSIKS